MIGYQFTKSNVSSDGVDYFLFNLEPEKLNEHGLISGVRSVDFHRDHKHQNTTISTFVWLNGAPHNWQTLKVVKGEILEEIEIPEWLEKLGLKIK
jgi:hypothetical protein